MIGRALAAVTAAAVLAGCAPLRPAAVPDTPAAEAAGAGSAAEPPQLPPPTRFVGVADALPPTRWAAAPVPGVRIGHVNSGGEVEACTLGPAVRGRDGRAGFLIVGHCADGSRRIYWQAEPGGATSRLGVAETPDYRGPADPAVVWAEVPLSAQATTIAGHPVRGVLPSRALDRLAPGTPLFIRGQASGTVRTELHRVDMELLRYAHVTRNGDSGSPVYVLDHAGNAWVVGVHQGYPGATRIDTALYAVGAEIMRHPA